MKRSTDLCLIRFVAFAVCLSFSHIFVRAADQVAAHWAFEPIDSSRLESHSLDDLVDHALAARGLHAPGPASKETLLRRVYFDLIGLPPTPAEIDAFVANESPAAYEEAVDRLLANPQHGVRYARHWLDVLRYADVDRGMPAEKGIHRWRDWVIDALNRDLPYDQFVRAQIAGDLSDNPSDRFAVGFLARGARSASDNAEEIAFAAVDTASSAFLGMTVACAKCHDHFYDDVTQREYYQMKALFDGLVLQKEIVADDSEKAAHEQVIAEWNSQKQALQKRLDAITDPYYPALYEERLKLLPKNIEAIYRKPENERTPEEQELADNYAPVVRIDARKFRDVMPPEKTARYESIRQELVKLERDPPALPEFWGVKNDEARRDERSRILISADTNKPGEKVTPGFAFSDVNLVAGETPPRLDFVDWLTSRENPIFARVVANRIWRWHFGSGLVATPSDFGRSGAVPTHPELLDWLATKLIENDFSMKSLHRLIVTSQTYQRDSSCPPSLAATNSRIDPSNQMLWKFRLKRLEAEIIHDALLFASGDLDLTIGGKSFRAVKLVRRRMSGRSVGNYDTRNNRRGIYMGRGYDESMQMHPDMLQIFDAEDGQAACPAREATITAPQALFMLNSAQTQKAAEGLANRLRDACDGDCDAAAELGFKIALGRSPTPEEKANSIEFLLGDNDSGASIDATRLHDFAWTLLNLTEFIYVK